MKQGHGRVFINTEALETTDNNLTETVAQREMFALVHTALLNVAILTWVCDIYSTYAVCL